MLCVLTLASVLAVEGERLRTLAPVLVVLIAALKARLLILHYMEAKRASPHWRFLYEAWNFAMLANLLIGTMMS